MYVTARRARQLRARGQQLIGHRFIAVKMCLFARCVTDGFSMKKRQPAAAAAAAVDARDPANK